jgi:hypothetical protein
MSGYSIFRQWLPELNFVWKQWRQHNRFTMQCWLKPQSVVLNVTHFFFGLLVIASHAAPTTSSVQTDALCLHPFICLSHPLLVSTDCLTIYYTVSLDGVTMWHKQNTLDDIISPCVINFSVSVSLYEQFLPWVHTATPDSEIIITNWCGRCTYTPLSFSSFTIAVCPGLTCDTSTRPEHKSASTARPTPNAWVIVDKITPTGPVASHPATYRPAQRVSAFQFSSSSLSSKTLSKCWTYMSVSPVIHLPALNFTRCVLCYCNGTCLWFS